MGVKENAAQRGIDLAVTLPLGNIEQVNEQIIVAVNGLLRLPIERDEDSLARFDDRRRYLVAG